ncbi:MAG: carboxypeptidase regulatory-like domain-containing protein [Bryobacteraceae bacterium]
MSSRRILVFAAVLVTAAHAQQFRGTITGSVTDAQQALVPDVPIVVTHIETGSKYESVSSGTGQYTIPFLQPGAYRLEAQVDGFKRYVREPIQVSANQQVSLDIVLEIGQVADTVTVSAEAPVLVTSTASSGQVITQKQIANMPMNGRTPLVLAQLAFGVVPDSDPRFTRPFDNSGPSGFSMGGAPSRSNELLIDGSPDTTRNRRVAYNPPVDSVEEVKVETFQADAAYGNTGGGTVNVVMKGGTNTLHGNAYNFNQVSKLAATDFFVNRAGNKKNNLVFNQWGVNAGGPVWIPKLLDGRNRVFWYFAYEGIKDRIPEPLTTTVPTDGQRNGDFSALLNAGSNYAIYDPLTGRREGSRVRRDAFPGNVIPASRLSPIARNYLQFYPTANQTGRVDGQDNYLVNTNRGDNFNNELGRLDFNISDRHKLFWNFRHNERLEFRGNSFQNIATGNNLVRINWGSTLDDVYTFSPTVVLNTRLNWTRFTEGGFRPSLGFDQTSLGFPSSLAAVSTQAVLPLVDLNRFNDLGTSGTGNTPFDNFQIYTSLTKITGAHSLKMGADLRLLRESSPNFGNSSGSYTFRENWTRGPLDNSPTAPLGQDLAAFMLGLPTGGAYDVGSFRTNQAGYVSLFLQDDWRASRSLTLNLGLRYEKELPTTERFNRQVVGFDPGAQLGLTGAAQAAYARNPVAGLPASQFNPTGGIVYASSGRRAITETSHLLSPRIGMAWSANNKTVVRAGGGLFYFTEGLIASQQPGYFQRTPLVASLDGFLTPAATLGNPFPNGVLQPDGNSNGVNTFLGQGVRFYNPKVNNPYSIRWNVSVQRELSANTVVEVGYMGNHGVRLTGTRNLNWTPRELLSTSAARDQATIDRLTAQVPNPFQGLIPGTSLDGSRVASAQLFRAFPQFPGDGGVITDSNNFGGSFYHMVQTRFERRLASGVQFVFNYQFSKLIERRNFLNESDFAPEKRIANEDRPHRLIFSGLYELPFGKGKPFAADAGPLVGRLVSGWTVNAIYAVTSGDPVEWGNLIYLGGPLNWDSRNVDNVFDTTRFNTDARQQLDQNIRTFSTRFSGYRQAATNNVDFSVIKDTSITEKVRLQYRCEFFNSLNHPAFRAPNLSATNRNFGKITAQANLPRIVQMALKLVW